jgi:hypothetical protein
MLPCPALPYSCETGSLTDSGARLAASSPVTCSLDSAGRAGTDASTPGFLSGFSWGFELGVGVGLILSPAEPSTNLIVCPLYVSLMGPMVLTS